VLALWVYPFAIHSKNRPSDQTHRALKTKTECKTAVLVLGKGERWENRERSDAEPHRLEATRLLVVAK